MIRRILYYLLQEIQTNYKLRSVHRTLHALKVCSVFIKKKKKTARKVFSVTANLRFLYSISLSVYVKRKIVFSFSQRL